MIDVDFERLADFLCGALDGTPEEETVRRLVTTEPAWTAALHQLNTATAAVSHDLMVLAAAPADPIPADVLARLDTALAEAGPAEPGPGGYAPAEAGLRGPALPAAPLVTVGQQSGRHAPRGRGQRLRQAWNHSWRVRAMTATAAVALAGLALVLTVPRIVSETSTTTATKAGGDLALSGTPERATDEPPITPTLLTSGSNYSRTTVTTVIAAAQNPAAAGAGPESLRAARSPQDQANSTAISPQGNSPTALARLTNRTALDGCLAAVTKGHGGQVSVVDFARFDDQPALIVVLVGTAETPGRRMVVVVGPSCGQPSGASDERYAAAG